MSFQLYKDLSVPRNRGKTTETQSDTRIYTWGLTTTPTSPQGSPATQHSLQADRVGHRRSCRKHLATVVCRLQH